MPVERREQVTDVGREPTGNRSFVLLQPIEVPAIIVFRAIGVFSLSNTEMDVYFMAALLGYIFRKIDAEPAPMLLGFILVPMMEEFLRRALLPSKGSPLVLVTRPISATMLALSVLALVAVLTPALQKKREQAFHEQE